MDNHNKTPQQLAEEKKAGENVQKVEAAEEPATEEKPPVAEPTPKS